MEKPPDFAPWLGVFETLRVEQGVALFEAEHLAQLRCAMEALGFSCPVDLDEARNQIVDASGRWRWIARPGHFETMFTVEETARGEPMALSVSPLRLGSHNWDARFKTLSYLTHAQALKIASTPEVVLLNEHGHVASAARGNLFWRRGDRLYTPAHHAGCREGVVRGWVRRQHPAEEGHYPLDHLAQADEVFFTNSLRGIVSIASLESETWRGGHPLADRLRDLYRHALDVQRGLAS